MTDADQDTMPRTETNTEIEKKTTELNHFKNAMSTTLAMISIASCCTKMYLVETTIAVGLYYIYDFSLVNTLYKIHHIAALVFLAEFNYMLYHGQPIDAMLDIMMNLEITTPFWTLCLYYNNNYCKLLFFSLFFYCRVYKEYHFLLTNDIFTLYPIFLLNLFWFAKMVRHIKLFNDSHYILLSEQINSYIYLLNFYFFKWDIQGFAILCLSISSYLFHQKNYEMIKYNKPMTELVPYIIADTASIHLRIVSFIKPQYYIYSIPLHIISFTQLITKMYRNDKCEKPEKLESTFIITALPIVFDLFFNYETEIFFNNCILFLVLYVKPFRNMNFVLFHLFLLHLSYLKH